MRESGRAAVAGRPDATTFEGLVVRTESGFHRVLAGDRIIVCRAPKRLFGKERTTTTAIVIGDHVRVRALADGTGVIEEILPRENELVRGAAGGSRFLDVIAANLDQLITVHSLREPNLSPDRLDRYLVISEAAEIPPVIVLNKVDLAGEGAAERTTEPYRAIGYPVLLTSAFAGEGVDALRETLRGKISALVGPSGVGKSSLLNRVQPGLHLRTAEVSEATGTGRHTTTTAELLPLTAGGFVADTPGLGELTIREVDPEELDYLFPEFRPFIPFCRFSDCTHREEIDCAVRAAVERGEIWWERYQSYRRMYEQVEATSRPY